MNEKKNKIHSGKSISRVRNNKEKNKKKVSLNKIEKNYTFSKKEKKIKNNNITTEKKKSKHNITTNLRKKESLSKINNKIKEINNENSKIKFKTSENNSTKRKLNNNKKKKYFSGNKKEIKSTKINSPSINITEIRNTKCKTYFKNNEIKETISTNVETNIAQENKSNIKNNYRIENKLENNLDNILNINESQNENNSKENVSDIKRRDKRLGTLLTPIPKLMKKKDGKQIDANSKDIQNAIVLRRLEYNDYIKNLNKQKPRPKQTPKLQKPKVYDNNKVNEIQKMYKGFQTRNINQIINRLKINLCITELYCLILNETFNHATRRISFLILKLYYHEPFNLF